MEKRTDLALEIKESFPEDDVEVSGVSLEEKMFLEDRVRMTKVKIFTKEGAEKMGKPQGNYITLEFTGKTKLDEDRNRKIVNAETAKLLADEILKLLPKNLSNKKQFHVLVAGLGNRFATPDALGPFVIENIKANRHIAQEYGTKYIPENALITSAIAPGVMAQTGMETKEILEGIIAKTKPDAILVIDALASRSVNRLCRTVQLTDTGISPGAGIGNNRHGINQDTIGIPVIAMGVPTVVDASTIVTECMEETLQGEGFDENQILLFLKEIQKDSVHNLFVTPKDIDEQLRNIGKIIALSINYFVTEKR